MRGDDGMGGCWEALGCCEGNKKGWEDAGRALRCCESKKIQREDSGMMKGDKKMRNG